MNADKVEITYLRRRLGVLIGQATREEFPFGEYPEAHNSEALADKLRFLHNCRIKKLEEDTSSNS